MSQVYGKRTPDLMQQFDALLEDAQMTLLYRLRQEIALEVYLNEPCALFPGERDTEDIDVTEYPFG